jgi:hypothetical protein
MISVAIVHYHLGPGGVSKVIAAASRAMTDAGIPHVILAGSDSADLPVRVIPELGYRSSPGDLSADELVGRLRSAAHDALGKTPLFPGVVACLAEENERIVLQIHDLAEDGRPGNYQLIADCLKLYPVSPRIHYAFLNSRDLHRFTAAGLPKEYASLLPNSISPSASHGGHAAAASPPSAAILFASVRGIRRKNLGELVFLSAIAPAGTRFAISRAPLNPDALAIHDTWQPPFPRPPVRPDGCLRGLTDKAIS